MMIKKASCILGCPLDLVQVVGERRTIAKPPSLMENDSHPMQGNLIALERSFTDGLLHPMWVKERYHRSFPLAAVRLYNQHCSH